MINIKSYDYDELWELNKKAIRYNNVKIFEFLAIDKHVGCDIVTCMIEGITRHEINTECLDSIYHIYGQLLQIEHVHDILYFALLYSRNIDIITHLFIKLFIDYDIDYARLNRECGGQKHMFLSEMELYKHFKNKLHCS
jgi:hypothetical protein